jgi:hypothetical protein
MGLVALDTVRITASRLFFVNRVFIQICVLKKRNVQRDSVNPVANLRPPQAYIQARLCQLRK